MKTRRVFYNLLCGLFAQIITIAVGILLPRLVLVSLGSESNGLMNSINQIFVYFSLLEAGVGSATLQALYGPVGKEDHASTSRILAATDKYYKKTGFLYLAAFLTLSVVYPLVIETELARSTIFWVVVLTGFSSVISYFFQGKYNLLLVAEGKNYIGSNLGTITYILTSISKIFLLLNGFGVIALQAMHCFFNILRMLYIEWYIHRHYSWIDLHAEPDYKAIEQKNSVFIHQISGMIFNNTDIVILSLFVGLKSVSVYSMYMLLFGMVGKLISTCVGSINFIFGQTFHNDHDYYMKLHNAYELYYMALVFSLFCIANIFILPFIKLYTRGVTDIEYIDHFLPVLFISYYLLHYSRDSSGMVIQFAGHFKQNISKAILESAINLTVSIIGVQFYGIYGVLFGTIAALLYRANDMIIYANKVILKRSSWKTYRCWITNLLLFIGITWVTKIFLPAERLDSYASIILYAVVCCLVIIPVFFAAASLLDRQSFVLVKSFTINKLKHLTSK